MTTITKYVCDLCGETFDDEDECQEHELLEGFGHYSNDIVFFDENKKAISINDILTSEKEIWGIYVGDETAIPSIENFFDYLDTISPWSILSGEIRKVRGLYLYDEENYGGWYLPADKIEEIKKEMKEYGVDA